MPRWSGRPYRSALAISMTSAGRRGLLKPGLEGALHSYLTQRPTRANQTVETAEGQRLPAASAARSISRATEISRNGELCLDLTGRAA